MYKKRFWDFLEVNELDLNKLIKLIESHYKEIKLQKRDKDGNVKSDDQRIINDPSDSLKRLQKKIIILLKRNVEIPDYYYGGIKGKSNVDNARLHKGLKYHYKIDLYKFFPSISYKKVHSAINQIGFIPYVSHIVTKLTTLKGKLPQGAPTSPIISCIVLLPTAKKLNEFCQKNDIRFSIFVDDITFSAQYNFMHLTEEISNIICSDGFKISRKKCEFKTKMTVTGIDVRNNYIKAPKYILARQDAAKKIDCDYSYTNYINYIKKVDKRKHVRK